MSAALIARIKKNRELTVTVDKFKFICRRPTDIEAVDLHRTGGSSPDIAAKFVIGWEGVADKDVVSGGGSDPVVFDAELWREWCADRPDFWAPISTAVLDAYRLHADEIEAAAKK